MKKHRIFSVQLYIKGPDLLKYGLRETMREKVVNILQHDPHLGILYLSIKFHHANPTSKYYFYFS